MPAPDWTQPPLPPPADRPVWPGDPTGQRRGRRLPGRALALSLATAAAVGTGMLAADLTSHASTATTGSTAFTGTTSTGTSSAGFAQAAAPGTTSGSATVHASSGGS